MCWLLGAGWPYSSMIPSEERRALEDDTVDRLS